MSADSYAAQKPAAAACAVGVAALIYGAALSLLAGAITPPLAQAANGERESARDERPKDEHAEGRPRGDRHPQDNRRRQRDERERYERQHYWQYQQPIYEPPPVYNYPPQASPGINLVLPLEIRIR
jgi:hypothetical protein